MYNSTLLFDYSTEVTVNLFIPNLVEAMKHTRNMGTTCKFECIKLYVSGI